MSRGYKAGVRGGGGIIPPGPVVPDGKTVTPINDIPIWLKCAGIPTTTYTTLTEVLADTSLLRVLINSENAMDYLVRCKAWIGLGLVPKMTSNTTPSGEVFASAAATNYPAWYAFDKNTSTKYVASDAGSSVSIGYHFIDSICVKKLSWKANIDSPFLPPTSIQLQGSNDNSTWNNIGDIISNITQDSDEHSQTYNNNDSYSYYRLICTSRAYNNHQYVQFSEIQFYATEEGITDNINAMQLIGANDYASNLLLADEDWAEGICNSEYFEIILNTKVPTMASATAPSGEVITSSNVSGFDGYKAFDNNASTSWRVNSNVLNGSYIIYHFTKKIAVHKVVNSYRTGSGSVVSYTVWGLYGSNDNDTYTDIGEINANGADVVNILANSNKYSYYKLVCKSASASGTYYGFAKLQFYGRPNGGVQSWLVSAGITNKAYTSLSEVFSDTETLRALLNNHDAVYYLTTVPSWASTFAANENAMKYIGANDYASDVLLANEDWLDAIAKSTYYAEILNTAVPTMTSNTTPEGECFGDATNGTYNYQAFDGNDSSRTYVTNQIGKTIGYQFTSGCKVKKVFLKPYWNGDTYNVEGSNDGDTWDNIGSIIGNKSGSTAVVNAMIDYTYYRFNQSTRISSNNLQEFLTAQFYGRSTGGVQSWLLAAGITNKNYTTLAQVLADSDLLPVLIASHSGMDYLATCTSWASTICNNEDAMTYIGSDNYAADALLSDETWLNAICNSTYKMSVFNVTVPTMTSNTTPSGICSASSVNIDRAAWKAFDGSLDPQSQWQSTLNVGNGWIQYEFPSTVCVKNIRFMPARSESGSRVKDFELLGSNDGFATSDTLLTGTVPNEYENVTYHNYGVNNSTSYKAYKLKLPNTYETYKPTVGIVEMQLNGRQDVNI